MLSISFKSLYLMSTGVTRENLRGGGILRILELGRGFVGSLRVGEGSGAQPQKNVDFNANSSDYTSFFFYQYSIIFYHYF